MSRARSVLSDALKSRLTSLGERLYRFEASRLEVAQGVSEILALPPHQIGRADRDIRDAAGLDRRGHYLALSLLTRIPGAVRRDFSRSGGLPGLEVLDAFHADGRRRASGLARMAGPCSSAFEVAIILHRLNDWASPVREAAWRCAERRFPVTDPSLLATAWIALADRLHLWSRGPSLSVVMADLVARPDVQKEVARVLLTSTTGPLLAALRQVLKQPGFDSSLTDWALLAASSQVRARAMATLLAGAAIWTEGDRPGRGEATSAGLGRGLALSKSNGAFNRSKPNLHRRPLTIAPQPEALISAAARDPAVVVRRAGASALVSLRDSLKDASALAALYRADPNASVRRRAEWVTEQLGRTERAPVAP